MFSFALDMTVVRGNSCAKHYLRPHPDLRTFLDVSAQSRTGFRTVLMVMSQAKGSRWWVVYHQVRLCLLMSQVWVTGSVFYCPVWDRGCTWAAALSSMTARWPPAVPKCLLRELQNKVKELRFEVVPKSSTLKQ